MKNLSVALIMIAIVLFPALLVAQFGLWPGLLLAYAGDFLVFAIGGVVLRGQV